MTKFRDELILYFKGGQGGFVLETTEHKRAIYDICTIAYEKIPGKEDKWFNRVIVLSPVLGGRMYEISQAADGALYDSELIQKNIEEFFGEFISECDKHRSSGNNQYENNLIIIENFHKNNWNENGIVAATVQRALEQALKIGTAFFFICPNFQNDPVYSSFLKFIDYGLPDEKCLGEILNGIIESKIAATGKALSITEDQKIALVAAAKGLGYAEATNSFSIAAVKGETENMLAIDVVNQEKIDIIKKSNDKMLDYMDPNPEGFEAVGGLDNLKEYILMRKNCFSKEAKEFGLPYPKGVVLLGVPGSGKSLCSKIIGTILNIPTLKLDVSKIFSSLVGESERKARDVFKLAKAISPCIMIIDEADKAFSGTKDAHSGDSGVGKRIFGIFLTELQENKEPIFTVMTVNNIEVLPPEFLRKGRFDEIFTLDLPNDFEREEIFKIHLKKRNRNPKDFNLKMLVANSIGYTGSEIEQAIIDGLHKAFADRIAGNKERDLTSEDISGAIASTYPLSKTMAEDIKKIREFGDMRARPANKKAPSQNTLRKLK